MKHRSWLLLLFILLAWSFHSASAQSIILAKDEEEKLEAHYTILPFALYTETYSFGLGVAATGRGYIQDQMSMLGVLIGSFNLTFSVLGYTWDTQMPYVDRLFLDTDFSFGNYTNLRAYTGRNPDFPFERPGTNDSDPENFIQDVGSEAWLNLKFKYLLPLGHGKDTIINTYVIDRGLLDSGATGGGWWNPLETGRTYIKLKTFYRSQLFDFPEESGRLNTNGLQLALEYDNRDFHLNPSDGSQQRLSVTRDFGALNSTDSWTFVELELKKIFNLGASQSWRQRVIALDFWTGDTPTWTENTTSIGEVITHRAPYYTGANLGGTNRMRSLPNYRFNDRSVVYYSAELRGIPDWNPLGEYSFLEFFNIKWMQYVAFAEVARVASEYDLKTLHSDMQWSTGVGLRLMSHKAVVGLDLGIGSEGVALNLVAGHPF